MLALLCAPPVLYSYLARYVWDRDPFVYAQLAKEVLSGQRLYTEVWQDKPPLAVVAYMVPQLFAQRSYTAISLFAGLCVAVTALMYAVVFRRDAQAMLSTVLFITLFGMTRWERYTWPSTEIFSNLFVAGVLLLGLVIHRDRKFSLGQCAWIGTLTCLAFHVRQNTVLCVLPALVSIAQTEATIAEKARGVAALVGAGIASCAAMVGLVAWLGDVPMYFWTVFVYPRSFASMGSFGDLLRLWEFGWQGALPFLLVLSACLAIAKLRDFCFVAVCVGAALMAVCAPMRNHTHYWSGAFPYIALLIGMAVQRTGETSVHVSWALTSMLALSVIPAAVTQTHLAGSAHTFEEFRLLAESADRSAPDNATLFVCGEMGSEAIQFASQLPPANTYEWGFQLQPGWDTILPISADEIIAQYLEKPPDVLVALRAAIATANAESDPSRLTSEMRLLRALTTRHRYVISLEKSGYIVARRSPGG